ncbi:SDR family NAD(P)-dependent oxidoreductase [Mangrovihabitans endophyticus]|uniref:Short-chain dehydrogenase n=1 Tax=Mangrovihabitans endophyticus TaxID=1751298 RepID=A0A8J3BX01_9ACTN|nr:SDR family oxidoreductase [Mangrovihabitans endophyticus]GGK87042.1 short-chain dehydrogenase [Mangrovihabitans endophyticus]
MTNSYVVTGGGRGVGRAIVERLAERADAVVVVIEFDAAAVRWIDEHPARARLRAVIGDASDGCTAERAVDEAAAAGVLRGWVNNAAVFVDAWLHADPDAVTAAIGRNLSPAVVGSAAAARHFLATDRPGAIVNVSSHQAQRAVRGALAYATAKAAIEGLTRALAVDYGPHGIRTNAVALGSIATERSAGHLAGLAPDARADFEREIARAHPLGRMGSVAEVASAVAFLLSAEAAFVNGTVLAVDGGRAALGRDPEEL